MDIRSLTVISILSLSAVLPLRVRADSEQTQPLSVDETLKLLDTRGMQGDIPQHYQKLRHANPAAREKLYEILRDDKQMERWQPAIGLFAYVGDQADVQKLVDFTLGRKGKLEPAERNAVLAIFDALGGMAGRGVQGASEKLDLMTDPKYWAKVSFKIEPSPMDSGLTFVNGMVAQALVGYALALRTDFSEKTTAVVNRIPDPAQRKLMEAHAVRIREFAAGWKESKERLEKTTDTNGPPSPSTGPQTRGQLTQPHSP